MARIERISTARRDEGDPDPILDALRNMTPEQREEARRFFEQHLSQHVFDERTYITPEMWKQLVERGGEPSVRRRSEAKEE